MKEEEEREERRKREEEEREARRRREEEEGRIREEERDLRLRELQLREDELARQSNRDKVIGEKKQSLTKFFGEAMKNVFWKFPQDPGEIPGYFDHVEDWFSLYEVDDVKSKLLQAHLNDRAKALTVQFNYVSAFSHCVNRLMMKHLPYCHRSCATLLFIIYVVVISKTILKNS